MPADLTVGQFVYVIRKRIKLSPEKAIFIFVKNVLPPTGAAPSPAQPLGSRPASPRCPASSRVSRPRPRPPSSPPPRSPPTNAAALMSSVYEDHKDEDGFLYITYSGENTFGGWQLLELEL